MSPRTAFVARVGRRLEQLGLAALAEVLIDAARPFALLGAQTLYLLDPFVGQRSLLRDLGQLLENPQELEELAGHLRRQRSDE